ALYQLYEEVRRDEGMLTFDDQLMTGWELLVRHPDILKEWQARYRAVLVDEFQDVNRAQAEILDLLTAPHRNYMAIGDDDQTIYEWRGADPRFILDFERRYRAQVYFMTENFRCKAGQIVLANGVIRHNRRRRDKALQLTQGFDGVTAVYAHGDAEQMGSTIAKQVLTAQSEGIARKEIAILVRVYAQTPPVEQALITLDIPYVVEGDLPFYLRAEVQALVDYCRLAFLEKQLTAGNGFTPEQVRQFEKSWRQVYWQPKRYISRELAGQIESHVIRTGQPLHTTLRTYGTQSSASVADKLVQLGETIHWLAGALPPGRNAEVPAAKILRELETRLNYRHYLEEESGFAESGAARADTVTAFLDYAEGKGTLLEFLQMLRQLAARQPGNLSNRVEQNTEDKVTITTIFRAKGREWPVVIVPHVNEGFLPYKTASNIEEERRLLYVAITRARRDLHLHYVEKYEISPFLAQARHTALLGAVQRMVTAIRKGPEQWDEEDQRAIATYTEPLNLSSYFTDWAGWQEQDRQQAAGAMTGFFRRVSEQKLFGRLKLRPNFADLWRRLANGESASTLSAPRSTNQSSANTGNKRPATATTGKSQKRRSAGRAVAWESGMRVRHATWGVGTVINVLHSFTPAAVWVRFDERRGPKRFSADTDELRLV
ncbi:MAG: ATP-dependent helicase, partial [Caldilineaceae bacterium]|nr:ATP-dependent helicase [Caldilineaceae bacterium]